MLQKGKSLAQNIDRLFFEPNAKLKLEFDRLYSSLFTNAEDCKKIVRLLAKKQQGIHKKNHFASTICHKSNRRLALAEYRLNQAHGRAEEKRKEHR